MNMAECKKCGKTFIDSKAKSGHICDKIEQGKATVKKADIIEKEKSKK